MAILKRSIGLGTLLLALIGLLLCVGATIGVWLAKSRVDAVGTAVFGAADDAFAFVDTKLDHVKQVVEKSRQRVSGISRIAERLKNAEADAKKDCEPLLQALDEVHQELKSAESWLDSSHAVASGVSRVSEALASSDFASSRQDSVGVALAVELQDFADTVADALASLQAMRSQLIELRDSGELARDIAVGIVARLADLDGKLANMVARIEKLEARVGTARAHCGDLGRRFGWWTVVGAVIVSIVVLWFGISQIVMMGHGWRLARASETVKQ
jgi:chromosome segregation ATPase